ncbi:MAG: XdhC family protein [Anaerolineales bacterium]|nr:XdhC family protein [Anaerolineales bacterium]
MQEIIPDIERWHALNKPVALATVIETFGSSPRPVGAKMALTADGEMTGSVSGGCVEGAVVEAGVEVLRTGKPQLLHFGVSDDTAWNVGLACGGQIDVFVRLMDWSLFKQLKKAMDHAHPIAYVTVVRGPAPLPGEEIVVFKSGEVFSMISEELGAAVKTVVDTVFPRGESQRMILSVERSIEIFVDVLLPAPTLIVVGGVHIAIALVALAKTLGYRTIIIDPRRHFGSQVRFPAVDRLVHTWPDEALVEVGITPATAVVLLTHDPKIDDPGLIAALPSSAFYIGALGSRKTQAARRKRMLEAGFTESQVDRLHGPIGLDIHARTPEEIALAIMAEIVLARNG